MIFSIFVFISVLSVVLFLSGFIIDIPLLSMIGAVLFFGVGLFVVTGDVQVVSGETVNNTLDANGSVVSSSSVTVYGDYDFGGVGSLSFGFIFMILGAFLFVLSLTSFGGGW